MSGTGILADTVAVDCAGCGCALLIPTRLANEAGGPRCWGCQREMETADAREQLAAVTGERKPFTRGSK